MPAGGFWSPRLTARGGPVCLPAGARTPVSSSDPPRGGRSLCPRQPVTPTPTGTGPSPPHLKASARPGTPHPGNGFVGPSSPTHAPSAFSFANPHLGPPPPPPPPPSARRPCTWHYMREPVLCPSASAPHSPDGLGPSVCTPQGSLLGRPRAVGFDRRATPRTHRFGARRPKGSPALHLPSLPLPKPVSARPLGGFAFSRRPGEWSHTPRRPLSPRPPPAASTRARCVQLPLRPDSSFLVLAKGAPCPSPNREGGRVWAASRAGRW